MATQLNVILTTATCVVLDYYEGVCLHQLLLYLITCCLYKPTGHIKRPKEGIRPTVYCTPSY